MRGARALFSSALLALAGCAPAPPKLPTLGGAAPPASAPAGRTYLTGDGLLALSSPTPIRISDCEPALSCRDEDGDGLTDAWEELALDRLRPLLRLHPRDGLLGDPRAVVAGVARVSPASLTPLAVNLYFMIGYSRDYGSSCFGITHHHGDSERVALRVLSRGPTEVVVDAAYTAAHEGAPGDRSRRFLAEELPRALRYAEDPETREPRWVIYPSRDKHASYANPGLCERASRLPCLEEDCAGAGGAAYELLPRFANAGEERAPALTELSALGFPGDDAWAERRFCGGVREGHCASPVRYKLLRDPFAGP